MPEARLRRTRDAYLEPDVFEMFRRSFAQLFRQVTDETGHVTHVRGCFPSLNDTDAQSRREDEERTSRDRRQVEQAFGASLDEQ